MSEQSQGPRWMVWGQVVAGLVVVGAVTAHFTSADDPEQVSTSRASSEIAIADTTTEHQQPTTTTVAPTTTAAPPPTPPTTAPPLPPTTVPALAGSTISQNNAREKAAEYLDFTSFSRSGLIDQLQYEGFSEGDAAYGVDALDVDWNEQAAKKAAEYLNFRAFSRAGLVEQLLYEGFTEAEAEYGVSTTGL